MGRNSNASGADSLVSSHVDWWLHPRVSLPECQMDLLAEDPVISSEHLKISQNVRWSVLQVRRSNSDNLGITVNIFFIKTYL